MVEAKDGSVVGVFLKQKLIVASEEVYAYCWFAFKDLSILLSS